MTKVKINETGAGSRSIEVTNVKGAKLEIRRHGHGESGYVWVDQKGKKPIGFALNAAELAALRELFSWFS